jgi:hypothetical protein
MIVDQRARVPEQAAKIRRRRSRAHEETLMPDPDLPPDASELRARTLSRWDSEGGAIAAVVMTSASAAYRAALPGWIRAHVPLGCAAT